MKRYSVFALARNAGSHHLGWERAWRSPEPKQEYDALIIGGGGHALTEIIRSAANRLKPAGIIVINTVLIDNLTTAAHTLEDLGFNVDMVQVQVSRATPMPVSHRLEAANPVWIITGCRP